MAETTFTKDESIRFPQDQIKGEFDFIITTDSFDLNEANRSVIIWKGYIGSKNDTTLMYLVWDRIDEAMYMRVSKIPADGKAFDIMNTVETLNHRIYPALVDGAPTVAAQLNSIKGGFNPREIPEGNSMSIEIISLNKIRLTFTEEVFTNSLEPREVQIIALPLGYILELDVEQGGSGYTNEEIVSTEGGDGKDAICQVVANPTIVSHIQLYTWIGSSGYSEGVYSTRNISQGYGSGLEVYVYVDEKSQVTGVEISNPGSNYKIGDIVEIIGGSDIATVEIGEVTGGEVTGVTIPEWGGIIKSDGVDQYGNVNEINTKVIGNPLAGGSGYGVGNIIDLFGNGSGAQAIVTSIVDSPLSPTEPQYIRIKNISSETKKGFSINITEFSETLEHDTTYKVLITDVLNLSKQSVSMEAFATTDPEPQPCPAITSILFEAFGSGEKTLLPKTPYAPPFGMPGGASHTNDEFLYYGISGISWEEFRTQSEFSGSLIVVPESVTPPTTVYVYYRDGDYLLPDSTWIVGIIGSETDYAGGYEYVLYTLDTISDYKQLTPAGSSTDSCGTSGWGGDWGGFFNIQQFRIDR
jgi:hypothetical protein